MSGCAIHNYPIPECMECFMEQSAPCGVQPGNPIQQSTVNLYLMLQEKNVSEADRIRRLQDALDAQRTGYHRDEECEDWLEMKEQRDEARVKLREAEAACAEMRAAILSDSIGQGRSVKWVIRVLECANKTTIGAGWKSPEEVAKIQAKLNAFDEQIQEWQTASGLESGGDPSGVTPAMLEKFIGELLRKEGRLNRIEDWMMNAVPIIECLTFEDPTQYVGAYIGRLQQQLAEARKDSERLDWFHKHGDHIYAQQYENSEGHPDGWRIEVGAASDGSETVNIGGQAPTIREAIDAAQKGDA